MIQVEKSQNQTVNIRVLVAETDDFADQSIRSGLREAGIGHIFVDSGVSAIKNLLLMPNAFDCVVLEAGIDGMNAIDTARLIRTRFKNLPIILVDMEDHLQTEVQVKSVGMSYYLSRPYSSTDLLNTVMNATRAYAS